MRAGRPIGSRRSLQDAWVRIKPSLAKSSSVTWEPYGEIQARNQRDGLARGPGRHCRPNREDHLEMMRNRQRTVLRWIHIVFSIPVLGYIYSPFDPLPQYAGTVRFVAVPIMAISGLWMWKGHVFKRLTYHTPGGVSKNP